jgi:hypothetical protein
MRDTYGLRYLPVRFFRHGLEQLVDQFALLFQRQVPPKKVQTQYVRDGGGIVGKLDDPMRYGQLAVGANNVITVGFLEIEPRTAIKQLFAALPYADQYNGLPLTVLLEITAEYAPFLIGCRFNHFRGGMDREDIAPRRVTIGTFRARTLHLWLS